VIRHGDGGHDDHDDQDIFEVSWLSDGLAAGYHVKLTPLSLADIQITDRLPSLPTILLEEDIRIRRQRSLDVYSGHT
jgi:hypothetical protein